jgi:predicted XRE-type DNA-binding protein
MSHIDQNEVDGLVEWRPVWSGDDLEYYNKIKGDLTPRISLVKALRDKLNLSQKEVAELLETTQSNVSKIEAKADPNISVLRRMVEGRGGKLRLVLDMGEGQSVEIAA